MGNFWKSQHGQDTIEQIKITKNERYGVKPKNINPCTICGTMVLERKTCSFDCLVKHQSRRQTKYLKNPENRKKYRGNSGKSYMEESFTKWLNENYSGRFYEQVHFQNEENNKHGWADFVFPKEKIIIELDGTHHKNRIEIDETRDEYLTRVKGYQVYRIGIYEYYRKTKMPLVKALLSIS